MSDEPNTGSTPDASRDEPDGKRQRRSANDTGQAAGGGRNGNPNTGISAADPYAGHQDKLQYIDVEFWENKLDGTLAEGEIMWFPAQQYPWDLFTSSGNILNKYTNRYQGRFWAATIPLRTVRHVEYVQEVKRLGRRTPIRHQPVTMMLLFGGVT